MCNKREKPMKSILTLYLRNDNILRTMFFFKGNWMKLIMYSYAWGKCLFWVKFTYESPTTVPTDTSNRGRLFSLCFYDWLHTYNHVDRIVYRTKSSANSYLLVPYISWFYNSNNSWVFGLMKHYSIFFKPLIFLLLCHGRKATCTLILIPTARMRNLIKVCYSTLYQVSLVRSTINSMNP